jgi:hypothetical protein
MEAAGEKFKNSPKKHWVTVDTVTPLVFEDAATWRRLFTYTQSQEHATLFDSLRAAADGRLLRHQVAVGRILLGHLCRTCPIDGHDHTLSARDFDGLCFMGDSAARRRLAVSSGIHGSAYLEHLRVALECAETTSSRNGDLRPSIAVLVLCFSQPATLLAGFINTNSGKSPPFLSSSFSLLLPLVSSFLAFLSCVVVVR